MAKILLVEDDALFVKVYEKKLTREGMTLLAAYDGEQGVEMAKAEKPDLIILDLMLPKMAGSEVLKEIKEEPNTSAIPVIVLTNLSTSSEEVNRCIEMGVKETLLKTDVTPAQVVEAIKKYTK
jgi:two-component system alkaline phosphatase synthesis response regulator PhoP